MVFFSSRIYKLSESLVISFHFFHTFFPLFVGKLAKGLFLIYNNVEITIQEIVYE